MTDEFEFMPRHQLKVRCRRLREERDNLQMLYEQCLRYLTPEQLKSLAEFKNLAKAASKALTEKTLHGD